MWGATLGMTWRFEPVSRLRCHRPSPIVRASATRVPNALPPDCTNTPPAIGAPGSGAFPVALRAPSNAPDPIKQTAAIRSPDQGHAVPCRRWTPDLCGNRPPLTGLPACRRSPRLIATCRLHEIDPYDDLVDVLLCVSANTWPPTSRSARPGRGNSAWGKLHCNRVSQGVAPNSDAAG